MNERSNREDSVEVRDRSVRESIETESFLPQDRMDEFRRKWDDIQAGFVDDPQNSVQKAHGLVSSLVSELNDVFTRERSGLESQWNRGEQADTENLRVALQRYRAFFNRLLR
jgi:predicted NUDIX family phosphoesterase